ncbi:MAG: IS110 family transposase [Rhodobacter sp.]|nr:IS110 family transposase [Rhodobacter sp.]
MRLAAATLLAEAPELGQLEARQIAALAGLAPVTRESGTWRGKATIQGGRRPLRRALTMPTLTAIRRTRNLAALFTRLSAAGKPPGARPCRGDAQTPHPRQHTPARRTGLAGHKASTKPLTNTDTGLLLVPDPPVYRALSRAGGGNALRFLIPPERATKPSPLQWQGPSPLPQRRAGISTSRVPNAPGQRPPRPRRALPARRVGRWPLCLPDLPVYGAPSRAGGGNAMRFLFPPDGAVPVPGSRKVPRQAGGRISFPAPC